MLKASEVKLVQHDSRGKITHCSLFFAPLHLPAYGTVLARN